MELIAIIFASFVLVWVIAMLAAGAGHSATDRHDTQHPNNTMDGVDQIRMDENAKKR